MYRGPEFVTFLANFIQAYSSIDFNGKGYFKEEEFLSSLLVKKIPYTVEEIKEFIYRDNLFKQGDPSSTLDFEGFKRYFFPHLYHIKDDDQSEQEEENLQRLKAVDLKKDNKDVIMNKLTRLENLIKDKFQNNWVSVRKAFLDLDTDYDGFVTVEDILRYFGTENKEFDFKDLKKLIVDKDSKREGKISYADFSKWMGGVIHQSEGFYFRHDSMKNPQYEKNLKDYTHKIQKNNSIIVKDQINKMNIEHTVLEKIKFQWKTLKKAFIDLNQEKTGAIKPEELKLYLNHWGLPMTDAQFKDLFNKFDNDKDGIISYEDFQNTVGVEINPMEFLYFRQDNPKPPKTTVCKHDKCWQDPVGFSDYCNVHVKMFKERGMYLMTNLKSQVKNWPGFIKQIRSSTEKDDVNIIQYTKFLKILSDNGVTFDEKSKELIMQAFVSNSDRDKILININRLYSINLSSKIGKMYEKVDMYEEADNADLVDNSGYFGIFYREKVNLEQISQQQLIEIIHKNNKMVHIMKNIKEIDRDNNGYVTNQELDDIFKMHYEKELSKKDLKTLFKPFASIQNRILIDYKKLRDYILLKLKDKGPENSSSIFGSGAQSMSRSINGNFSQSSRLRQRLTEATNSSNAQPVKVRATSRIDSYGKGSHPFDDSKLISLDKVQPNMSSSFDVPRTPMTNQLQKRSNVMSPQPLNRSTYLIGTADKNRSKLLLNQSEVKVNRSDQLKQKLAYEWKNIYRQLSGKDGSNTGRIGLKDFETQVHKNGAFLTKEEIDYIKKNFTTNGDVEYSKLTKELGLQSNTLNLVNQTHKYLKDIYSINPGLKDQLGAPPVGTALSAVRSNRSYQSASRPSQYVANSVALFESHKVKQSAQEQLGGGSEYYKKISKILNKNLNEIKDALKKADTEKQGFLSEEALKHVMQKFNLSMPSLDKFKRGDQVDYIKFLKYYL